MNQDVKKAWVAALRSGDYEQGRHVLRDEDDRYCCLGVLCDLAVKASVINEPRLSSSGTSWIYDGCETTPSKEVEDWAGFDGSGTTPVMGNSSLIHLNDVERYTFNQIADIIEQKL